MAPTQEERREETRANLLTSAADHFARRGFHGVSVDAIAEQADRTTGALYDHFGSKEGLLFSLVEDLTEAAANAIVTDIPDPGDLEGIIAAAWEHITGDPEGNWLLLEMELWLHGARDSQIKGALSERYRSIRLDLASGLDAWAQRSGARVGARSQDLAALVLALLLGAALQHRLDPTSVDVDELTRAIESLATTLPPEHA